MVEIHFEDLPGAEERGRRQNGEHAQIAEQLKARPKEWACIGTHGSAKAAGSLAYAIRNGKVSAYAPAGTFQASARTVKGEHRLYVRFVGEPSNE